MAVYFTVLTRGGAWYYFEHENYPTKLKWNGFAAVVDAVREDVELKAIISSLTFEAAMES